MVKYRCPNCRRVITMFVYRQNYFHYGAYAVDSEEFEDGTAVPSISKDDRFMCPECGYLLGQNIRDAYVALIKEEEIDE